jgi:hypothetical protein
MRGSRQQRWFDPFKKASVGLAMILAAVGACVETRPDGGDPAGSETVGEAQSAITAEENAVSLVHQGRDIFRYDTFGDEDFWGGQLRLHEAIEGAANGGVGAGLSPARALALGLKVDADALSKDLVARIRAGQVNLDDPAVTVALISAGAVLGLRGFGCSNGGLQSIGITCALCHSTVDDSVAPGIGRRLDGWPNRDLNVGAIIALAPNLQPIADELRVSVATVRQVLLSWGPGKFDAELVLDGKAFRPDGKSAATLIPPALRLPGVNLHTWTGWGSIPYWNAFVATIEMHGKGNFYDPRLDDAAKFPLAAANHLGHIRTAVDLVTPKLPALHVFQLAIPIPSPPAGFFDPASAQRGAAIFNGKAKCASCHFPPTYTDSGWNMHTAAEIGIDDFQASRSPDDRYRTAPLRALFTHFKGGFYHDGRFPTLEAVVAHYDAVFHLGLSAAEKRDLIEFLKSL